MWSVPSRPNPARQEPPWISRRISAAAALVVSGVLLAGCGAGPGAENTSSPVPDSVPVASVVASSPSPAVLVTAPPVVAPSGAASPAASASRGALTDDRRAFADAYAALADSYARARDDILIANPLSEFDLVGTRLIDLLDQTRQQVAGLPALGVTSDAVRRLDAEMAATIALLREIDPHGPRGERATRYQAALDYWVEHVQPISDTIRAAAGLPPSGTGDLGL